MKKILLITGLFFCLLSVNGQINITSDSIVVCNYNQSQDRFIPVTRNAESLSLEIDKDLMILKVFGKGHEHAVIEKAYIIDLTETDIDYKKWMFQAEDKNCISYTITIDTDKKRMDLITFGKAPIGDKPLTMIYYPIVDIKIDKEAINKHIAEKANYK